jgi:hypothetical protein
VHDRHDLTDAEWDRLEPQLPDRTPARGGRWPDLRAGCDVDEGSQWTAGADSPAVGAHEHAAGARHAPPKDIPEHKLAPLLAAPAETSVESPAESTGDTGGWAESQEFRAREARAG